MSSSEAPSPLPNTGQVKENSNDTQAHVNIPLTISNHANSAQQSHSYDTISPTDVTLYAVNSHTTNDHMDPSATGSGLTASQHINSASPRHSYDIITPTHVTRCPANDDTIFSQQRHISDADTATRIMRQVGNDDTNSCHLRHPSDAKSPTRVTRNAENDDTNSARPGHTCDIRTLTHVPTYFINTNNGAAHSGSASNLEPIRHLFNDESYEETVPLLPEGRKKETEVYGRRWYLLIVFCLAAVLQGNGWTTWGPITQTSKLVFSWTDGHVALQPLWGNLAYVMITVPVTWMMDVKGLRVSMLFSAIFMALGYGLRCVSSEPSKATWLISVGQVMIGVGGSVPFAGVSLMAATWFPPSQRATATAICSVFSYVGVALSFVIGPQLVPEPANVTHNTVTSSGKTDFMNVTDSIDIAPYRDAIMRLLYYEAGAAGLLLLLVLVYFPATPPLPPCRSAAVTRHTYGEGIKALARNKRFWILNMAYAIPLGTYGALTATLDIDLNPAGISQTTAGWMGFYATIAGGVVQLLASRIADLFMRRLKVLLLVLYVGATGSLVWFCLLVLKYIPFDLVSVYVSTILTGLFLFGAVPLFYEAACEVTYPVAEGVTTGALIFFNNIVSILFFALLLVPGIGVQWINWVLLGTVVAALPLLLMVKQEYARIDFDTMVIDVPAPQP